MTKTILRVEHLSKMYTLGRYDPYRALRAYTKYKLKKAKRIIFREPPPAPLKLNENTILALNDVSFEIKEGEAVGIIGRNGAGKSTLLKILSRITKPTSGFVDIYGTLGSILEVGTGFHPDLTGSENIYLNGSILGLGKKEIDRLFDEIVAFTELEKFINTPVKYYSSGMYVRLAFAVSAYLERDILLLDEVLAVGDVAFQQKSLGKMNDLIGSGDRTILFVSHAMSSIKKFCNRVIYLENGSIKEDGSADDVISKYLNVTENINVTNTIELPESGVVVPGAEQKEGLDVSPPGRATLLRISDKDGNPRATFYLREPWRISLEFEIYKATKHFIAAVGLKTADQQVSIISFWSKPQDLQPGKYFVDFFVDIAVSSCDLELVVGLSASERAFYYHEGLGRVSVLDLVSEGEQPFRSKGSGLLLGTNFAIIQKVE